MRQAAVAARGERDFFIVARTDALAVDGMDEAVSRILAAREAGADGSFIEAPGSVEQLAEIGRRVPKPMVANMIEGGKTPVLPREQLSAMGFQLVLYPLAGLFAAAKAIRSVYEQVYREGTAGGASQMTFAEFNELIGVSEKYALAERFGAS